MGPGLVGSPEWLAMSSLPERPAPKTGEGEMTTNCLTPFCPHCYLGKDHLVHCAKYEGKGHKMPDPKTLSGGKCER